MMKCPHCDYEDWKWGDADSLSEYNQGAFGDFYELPIKLELRLSHREKSVYGCPSCSKLFME